MGVYGTSAPLDSFDIDYDNDDEETVYIRCSNCEEEYCEEELFIFDTPRGTWQENVCQNCMDAYMHTLDRLLDEAREQADELWSEGNINR